MQEDTDKNGRRVAWFRFSGWYWGAIGVIVLAVVAQFLKSAPVTAPDTIVSAALAQGVTLQIAYPKDVRPVLREADRVPIALTLQGAGAITSTVALSSSVPLLYTDSSQQVVAPRAELSVKGCCQSSTVFYPQASSGAWYREPVEVNVYAAPLGAPLPDIPIRTFTFYLEPVWLTWGRRVLSLFAELGLAVSVALALGGWAIERQRILEEQNETRRRELREDERQRRQREVQNQETLWLSRIEHAHKTGGRDLLAGVSELIALAGTLDDSAEGDQRRVGLDTTLQSFRFSAADPNSLVVEQCLEHIATRLQTGQTFTEDELCTLTFLFDDGVAAQGTSEIRSLVEGLSSRNDETSPDDLLQTTINLQRKFEYSLAICNLAIELIAEWYARIRKDDASVNVDVELTPLAHLMSDPRLAHIPFSSRTHLYRLSTRIAYQYPWANPDDVANIASHLDPMLHVDSSRFAEVPTISGRPRRPSSALSWGPRLPSPGFVGQPHLLKFPVYEDADCAAHLLHAYLIDQANSGLQRIDGVQDKGAAASSDEAAGKILPPDFVPFSVLVTLKLDTTVNEQQHLGQLKPLAYAIGEEWLALLACSPSLWSGLPLVQRSILAELLQLVVRTKTEIQYRLLHYRQNNRCQQQEAVTHERDSYRGIARLDDTAIIKKLAASISSHWQQASPADYLDLDRLETWLTLRPANFTHTVVVALVQPAHTTMSIVEWWQSWFHLASRLRTRNVIIHLLAIQLPVAPPLHRLIEDCAVPKAQLAELLDNAFGATRLEHEQHDKPNTGVDGCKIDTISRLLDVGSIDLVDDVTEALLYNAEGSPSRLLHMMYLVLKHRIASLQGDEKEFQLSHLDIVNVVQTYPKD